ncbi:hypothetical protein A2U01_0094875, partial [Trifolium medium]|nr:hypothetical protein [Trifolium medium]
MWSRQNESEEHRNHCSVFWISVGEVLLEAETSQAQPWMDGGAS